MQQVIARKLPMDELILTIFVLRSQTVNAFKRSQELWTFLNEGYESVLVRAA